MVLWHLRYSFDLLRSKTHSIYTALLLTSSSDLHNYCFATEISTGWFHIGWFNVDQRSQARPKSKCSKNPYQVFSVQNFFLHVLKMKG